MLGMALALGAAGFALLLAGTRSLAYALFYLAFLPFLTLDPTQGGLVAIDGLQGGNVAWKLGIRALSTFGIAVLAYPRRSAVFALLARTSSLPVLGLFVWALIGLPRAQDPWVSFFRLGELLAFFLTGIVLAIETGAAGTFHRPRGASDPMCPSDVVRLHALALLPVLISAIAFMLLHPEIAFHESSTGVRRLGHKFMNSNVLGFSSTVVFLWSLSALRSRIFRGPEESSGARGRKELLIAALSLGISGYVLYASRSRTASITTLGGVAILFAPWPLPSWQGTLEKASALRIRSQRRIAAGIAACGVAMLASLNFSFIQAWFMRGGTAADIATGTGRTGLWKDLLLEQVPKAPLLGAGYLNLSESGGFQHAGHAWNNAHSTYLFALVSTGIPGLLAVLLIVGLPLWASFQRAFRPTGSRPSVDLEDAVRDQEAWTLVFALQSIVAIASITGFGVAGYPNVAMLFHYGLYAWVLTRTASSQSLTVPIASREARPHGPRPADPRTQPHSQSPGLSAASFTARSPFPRQAVTQAQFSRSVK